MTKPRQARICPVESCSPRWRSFGDPKAICPEHKRGIDQKDKPYFQSTKKKKDKG